MSEPYYQQWVTRIKAAVDEASARGRYWTVPGRRWQAWIDEAEEAGVRLLAVLADLGLQILDTAQDGAVHLG